MRKAFDATGSGRCLRSSPLAAATRRRIIASGLVAACALALATGAFARPHSASAPSGPLPDPARQADDEPYWKGNPLYDDPANWSRGVLVIFKDGASLKGVSDEDLVSRFAPVFAASQVTVTQVRHDGPRDVEFIFDHVLHPAKVAELGRAIKAGDARVWDFDDLAPRPVGLDRVPVPGQLQGAPRRKAPASGFNAPPPGAKSFPSPDNDTFSRSQWALWSPSGGINLSGTRTITRGDGMVIAVLDTGYVGHPDLLSHVTAGYDFLSDATQSGDGDSRDADATDPGGTCRDFESAWHGTRTAGVAAAVTNNGVGISGVAANATVVPVRVQWPCASGTSLVDLAAGIRWAAGIHVDGVPDNAHPADVISMSLAGGGQCPKQIREAIADALAEDVPVVVGAGNNGKATATTWPANCPGVIAVAGTASTGYGWNESNVGPEVALSAPSGSGKPGSPGCDRSICIAAPSNSATAAPTGDWNYDNVVGTSFAAPEVAGTIALMFAANPELTPDEVRAKLAATARPFPGSCDGCGAGILDASAAVALVNTGAAVVTEAEGNAQQDKAQVLADNPVRVSGRLNITTGNDWYKVTLPAQRQLTAVLSPDSSTGLNIAFVDKKKNVIDQGKRTAPGAVDTVHTSNSDNSAATDVWVHITYAQGAVGTYTLDLVY